MADGPRFFLGYGERLTARVAPPGGGGGPEPAYSFGEAVERLRPMVTNAVQQLYELPDLACPRDEAVGVVTLHPQWVAKSYHPQSLLDEYALRQVGSRPVAVRPERWTRQAEPDDTATSELYVAGTREAFGRWASDLRESPSRISEQIRRVEIVRAPSPAERLRNVSSDTESERELVVLEVVLHASEDVRDQFILAGFAEYAHALGAHPDFDRRLHAGGLCFLPVETSSDVVGQLAQFSFLRVARPIPRLRHIPSLERSIPAPSIRPSPLPEEGAVDPDLRIAVFDGGLNNDHALQRWATAYDAPGVGPSEGGFTAHGHDVTSALLFGSLTPGEPAPRPYAVVDHYRVLDAASGDDPYELYDVLRRVETVLRSRQYEFFNLSIGPALPMEDDEVHPWTALLDQYLGDGSSIASLAIGNTGLEDRASGEARIQVPSDCVNGLSIGAADSQRLDWRRAPYSAWGPGRSPGIVKPDVVQFGGTETEQFFVYEAATVPSLAQTMGTSFAAPSALRLAAGVRAHFGERVSPLALKALLIHSADPLDHDRHEVGWGKVSSDVESIAVCDDGMVRVIYQGELTPAQYLRAQVPLPNTPLVGMVEIEATFCYATPTDPQDPGSYTRSGLEVAFRPHAARFANDEATIAKTASFFRRSDFDTEQVLRNDAQKWETTLHANRRFRSSSLMNPVFDVHYNARTAGGAAREAERIRYALVLTIRARRVPDLYDRVLTTFAGQLEALVPVIEIPIRV
ncbi:MAG: hypothetical protein QOH16_1883 [Gaiellaceae bacterium]|nr:hypothetical protein [Gaiellaceae bacterium]